MDNSEATCKSSANRQIIILLVQLSDYEKKKKADFVHIPCFAVKCYSCFTVEGSKQHSLIPNFWNLISDYLYLPGVFKIVGPETSVPKMYPGHILNTYEAKVQMYHFLPPSCILFFTGRKFRYMGEEGLTVCSTWSPSEQAQDHNSSKDMDGEGQRRDTLWNLAHGLCWVTVDI